MSTAPNERSRPERPGAEDEPRRSVRNRNVAGALAGLVRPMLGGRLPLRISAWDGSSAGPDGDAGAGTPHLIVHHRRALRRLLWDPDELGLARAYVAGDIDVGGDPADALSAIRGALATSPSAGTTALSRLQKARMAATAVRLGVIGPRPAPPAVEARLSGDRHTRSRDRDAIAHHYDLGNDFYAAVLDETMAYSCAYFTRDEPGYSLAEAQRDKLDLICTKLGLRQGMRLLDIGCGWGSLLIHAARHYGVRATGITLSQQQFEFVSDRISDAGLGEVATVRFGDYRALDDPVYDAIGSIEMGEHVGQENYGHYADVLFRQLRPKGRLLLQQMSRRRGAAPEGGAFIERYIAPDMHMRPVSQTLGFLEQAGFEIRDVQALREHYVATARAWSDTLEERWDRIVEIGGEPMARIWRLYLAGGALAFAEGRMGVDQVLAVRPALGGSSGLPMMPPWRAGPAR